MIEVITKIKVGGKDIELTLAEAKELQANLNTAFPVSQPYYPWYTPWWFYDYPYKVTYTGGTNTRPDWYTYSQSGGSIVQIN